MNFTMSYPDAIEMIKKKADGMGLSQVELADEAEISPSYLSRIFKLKRDASDQMLINLARAVKLDPLEILRKANRIPHDVSEDDDLDKRIKYLVKLFPAEEKERIVKRLELEAQFYERSRPAKPANKPRT